jgi:hypothetical protein
MLDPLRYVPIERRKVTLYKIVEGRVGCGLCGSGAT